MAWAVLVDLRSRTDTTEGRALPASATDHKHDPGSFACHIDGFVDGVARIVVRGELDISTAPALSRALGEALADGATVVLDLRGVSFCDSTAIHAIISAERYAREHGRRLVIIEGSAQVRRLFELVGLAGRLDIVRDSDDPGASARLGVSRWEQRRA